MKQSVSLNGVWQVTGRGPRGDVLHLDGTVPGMIHVDLEQKGLIPPMFWRDNANDCQWVEDWTWEYRRCFTLPEDADLRYAVLEFGGLDTYAEITVNGEPFAETENAQIPHRFNASQALHPGENAIVVTFTPYKDHIVGKRLDYAAAFNRSDRVHVRRMQCTFYWDWVNRFITAGLWRPVTLWLYDASYIRSVFVYTHDIARTSASLQLQLETCLRPDLAGAFTATGENIPPETAQFGDVRNLMVALATRPSYIPQAEVDILDPEGVRVWHERLHVYDSTIYLQADIRRPRLWWPVGYGDQPLYTCRVRLFGPDGALLDDKTTAFGIRTTRVEQLQDEPGSEEAAKTEQVRAVFHEHRDDLPGRGFVLLVNGERIFCKGGNWVPASPFPCTVTQEKYDRLVWLAADGGLNLLRCWGGGIYEPDAFFDACDKYGVMVSQDFQLACARFPEDDEAFMDKLRAEIPVAVRLLRNHPSIVWYAGDNENACHFDWDDPGAPGMRLCREVYYPTLQALDPSRPFFPTSPYGGYNNSAASVGDSHVTWYYEPGDYRQKVKTFVRFASECCTQGSTLFTTLRKFMTDEDIADPDYKMFDFHVKDNPHKPEGDPTLYVKSRRASELLFGKPANVREKIRFDSYQQYEWMRVMMEAARRNKWYTAGIQFWMYNDCWPTVGLAMVDYYLVPKAGYYGAKRTAKPVIASITDAEGGFEVWVLNDRLRPAEGRFTLYQQRFSGGRLPIARQSFSCPANENAVVYRLPASALPAPLDGDSQLVCELEGDFETDRAFYCGVFPKDMRFAPTRLSVRIDKRDERSGSVTVRADGYARVVSFDGDLYVSDNFFDLMPGEQKTVQYTCYGDFPVEKTDIYCWNGTEDV